MIKDFKRSLTICHSDHFQDPKFLAFTPLKESCYYILFLTCYSMKHVQISSHTKFSLKLYDPLLSSPVYNFVILWQSSCLAFSIERHLQTWGKHFSVCITQYTDIVRYDDKQMKNCYVLFCQVHVINTGISTKNNL